MVQVIKSMVEQAKGLTRKKPPRVHKPRVHKPRVAKKMESAKVTFGFCRKNGHLEEACWKRKKAEKLRDKPKTPTPEVRVLEVPEMDLMKVDFAIAESFDDLIVDLTGEK